MVNETTSVQEAAKSGRAHQPGQEVAKERSDKGLYNSNRQEKGD